MKRLRFGRMPNLRSFGILPKWFLPVLLISISLTLACPAQDYAQLSKNLTSGDRDGRREAAFQLRELGAAALPALPALITALGDDDEQVAARAVVTIALIGPEAVDAIPALIESMNPQRRRYDEQVVFRTAYALSEIGEAAIEPLRVALGSSSEKRRSGAAQALGQIGPAAVSAIPELIVALRDDGSEVRSPAAEALGAIGVAALEPLQADLNDSTSAAAIRAIGLIGRPAAGASSQLLELIEPSRDNKPIYGALIEALGALEISFRQLRDPLRTALCDDAESVRRAAASVLLTYPEPRKHSLPALAAWLGDQDPSLRSRAAWVVGQFGADAAYLAPDLIRRLELGDDQETVTRALAGLGPEASSAILQAVANTPLAELAEEQSHWARAILSSSGTLAIPALENGLESEHASVRFIAIDTLTGLGRLARPLVPKFRRAANDPEPPVRLAALLALESAGADPGRLAIILQRRCADQSAAVRAVAVRLLALGRDANPQAYELIDRALGDPDPAVQLAGIGALEKFGPEAGGSVAKLQALATDADADADANANANANAPRSLAILKTLASIGTPAAGALGFVRESLSDPDPQIRGAAIAALVAIEPDGEGLTDMLSEMLVDQDQAVRHPAIDGLGQRGEGAMSAAPQLFKLLDQDEDRERVLEALRRIRCRDVDLYIAALDNSDSRVRLFACEALGRLGTEAEKAIPQLERARKDRYDFVRRRADDAIKRIEGK